jgi:hypothetical protein
VLLEIVDDVVDLRERDPVAEPLLGAEDRQHASLVVGRVRAPERLLGDRRCPEVGVIEDRPVVAGGRERRRQVRLPDAFRQPRPARPPAEQRLELVGHPDELADPVTLRQGREDGLVPAAPDDLDLAPLHEAGKAVDERRPLRPDPGEERPAVVEAEADAGIALERLEHRQVRPVETSARPTQPPTIGGQKASASEIRWHDA